MQAHRQPTMYRAIPLQFSTSDWPQNNTLGDNNDLGLAALSPPQPPTQALTFLIASVKDGWGGEGTREAPNTRSIALSTMPCFKGRAWLVGPDYWLPCGSCSSIQAAESKCRPLWLWRRRLRHVILPYGTRWRTSPLAASTQPLPLMLAEQRDLVWTKVDLWLRSGLALLPQSRDQWTKWCHLQNLTHLCRRLCVRSL